MVAIRQLTTASIAAPEAAVVTRLVDHDDEIDTDYWKWMDENIRVPITEAQNVVNAYAAPSNIGAASDNIHYANQLLWSSMPCTAGCTQQPAQASPLETPGNTGESSDEDEMQELVDSSSDDGRPVTTNSDSSSDSGDDSSETAESIIEFVKRVYPPLRRL